MKNCISNNNAKIIDGLEETISYLRTRTGEVSERCIQYQREAIAMLKEDCHNCKLECLLQRYDQLKEKYEKLLKEQEAKPMTEYDDGWDCPRCGIKLVGKTASGYPCDEFDLPNDEIVKYCPVCGQAVKWE